MLEALKLKPECLEAVRRSLRRRGWRKGEHFTPGLGGCGNGLGLCPERSREPLGESKQRANVNRCAFEIGHLAATLENNLEKSRVEVGLPSKLSW